ncbi:MAG: Hpt domain-containing protein [Oligoflexus sp.]|nr:Hpt domain-containing protein [Oligoflexus sp.]
MALTVIDQKTLTILDDLFGNSDYLSELLPAFRDQITSAQIGFDSALSVHDGKSIIFHAHGLKSTSAQLGALRVSGVCLLLEKLAASPVWEEIQTAVESLKAEAAHALHELASLENQRRSAS